MSRDLESTLTPQELEEIHAANEKAKAFTRAVLELAKVHQIPVVSIGSGVPTPRGTITCHFGFGDPHVRFTLARMALNESDPLTQQITGTQALYANPNRENMS